MAVPTPHAIWQDGEWRFIASRINAISGDLTPQMDADLHALEPGSQARTLMIFGLHTEQVDYIS